MEKIPAACAMDWSIQLDKALRSKIPGGKSIKETIEEVGRRLEWWSREPQVTMTELDMFGLIPGEDNLFANAILLRLADAFVSGCRRTKLCVVRLFLSEFKQRKRNKHCHKQNEGFLSNCIVDYMEFLRRVKMDFDSEDVEVRALTLVLFGCCADFAKDIAAIRYLILSSVVSSHFLEVKASLFAAGCFSELADDFGSIFLVILVNIMSSSELSVAGRLAGAQAFAKFGCSISLAHRAYKKGLKLVLDTAEEDFSVAMLISLSKVASKSANLICEQVDLLLSYLNEDRAPRLQATSLKCLHFLFVKGVHHVPVAANMNHIVKTLFNMFNGAKFPPVMHLEVLQILYKILLYKQLSLFSKDMLELFTKLLAVAESVMQSPIITKRLLAIRILADISRKLIGRAEMPLNGVGSTLASRVISFVMDCISIIGELTLELHQPDLHLDQDVRNLLSLLLCLVEQWPDLGSFVMDKIYIFIDCLVNKNNRIISTDKKESTDRDLKEVGRDCRPFTESKLIIYLAKVVAFCLKNLEKIGAFTPQVHNGVKLMGERIDCCSLFDGYIHTIFSLLLRPYIAYYMMRNETDENNIQDRNLSSSDQSCYVQHEMLVIEGARKILADKNKWSAYKAGKCAASQGAWLTAAFIFGQLITSVKSDSCCFWLKFLHLFAYSEMTVLFLVLPKPLSSVLNWLEINRISILPLGYDLYETRKTSNYEINSTNFIENLVGACKILQSSGEILHAIILKSNSLLFQKWFLALRVRVLGNVVDILNLLGTVTLTQHNISSEGKLKGNVVQVLRCPQEFSSLTQSLRQISTRLNKLATEFDLIAISFLGMGRQSSMVISELALSCSILAFSTEFALSFPKVHSSAHGLENSVESLQAVLIQDLLVRFRDTDHETSKQLWSLLKACRLPRTCYILQSTIQRLENSCEVESIVKLCTYAVRGVVDLRNEANNLDLDEEVMFQITNGGLQLLLNIILEWMCIPFRIPTYFFQIRPSVTSQLFCSISDWKSGESISVMPGFHLPLNICLQLSNIPPDFQVRLTKLYCVLYCRPSFLVACQNGENKTQTRLDYQDVRPDDMLDLNEKLVRYVTGCSEISGTYDRADTHNCSIVETYACFEPNEKWQGFSTCLLDVSAFPSGSYRVKWQSCCVDSKGSYWSLPSLNAGPVFIVQDPDDPI